MRKLLFIIATLCGTASAQQVAVVNFQDVVTRNCAYSTASVTIQHDMKPELDAFAAFKGTPAEKKALAVKIQAKIQGRYSELFEKQSADVAAFERQWAHDKKYGLVLDSSVQDKNHRPLAVIYVDQSKDTGMDATEELLEAYNAKNGCAVPDLPASDHDSGPPSKALSKLDIH